MDQYKPIEKLELREIKKEFPKTYKKVNCPSCETEVAADNLNLQNSIAKCGSCNALFSIEEEIENLKPKKLMKQEVIRPEGIDLFHFKDDLDITVQQHLQGLNAMGLIFLPMLAMFSILIFFTKGIPIFYPLLFTLGSFYFIYQVLNQSKNKTFIDINDKFLSIRSRPKNFKKDRNFAASDIDQLYIKEAMEGSGYYTLFMVVNGLEGQKHEKLLTVNTLSKAKYLEQEIELYLNIEDKEVAEASA
jgi:hypothetical protein